MGIDDRFSSKKNQEKLYKLSFIIIFSVAKAIKQLKKMLENDYGIYSSAFKNRKSDYKLVVVLFAKMRDNW